MGIDVCALVQHDLDTSNIEILAEQLAKRLNATIIYGYRDYSGPDPTFDFVLQGTAGDNKLLSYQMDFDHWDDGMPEDDKGRQYNISNANDSDEWFHIYMNSFLARANFGGRWGSFCNPFVNEPKSLYAEKCLHDFRKHVFEEWRQLGCGDFVLYVPDNYIHSCLAWQMAGDSTWDEIIAFIRQESEQHLVLDMGKWYAAPVRYEDCPVAFIDDFSYWP